MSASSFRSPPCEVFWKSWQIARAGSGEHDPLPAFEKPWLAIGKALVRHLESRPKSAHASSRSATYMAKALPDAKELGCASTPSSGEESDCAARRRKIIPTSERLKPLRVSVGPRCWRYRTSPSSRRKCVYLAQTPHFLMLLTATCEGPRCRALVRVCQQLAPIMVPPYRFLNRRRILRAVRPLVPTRPICWPHAMAGHAVCGKPPRR